MQQVQVDMLTTQAFQAALTGRLDPIQAGVVWIHLADQEHLVSAPGDGLPHHLLCAALAIHLGGVDQAQSQIQALTQRGDLTRAQAFVLAHTPSPQAYHRYLLTCQFNSAHR